MSELQGTGHGGAGSYGDGEALARRAAAREREAWSELFERHYRGISMFVRYRVRSAEEAEDIASQVFEVAYSHADRFDYRGAPIEAWLIGIARNLVRDHVKKAARRGPEQELEDSAATTPTSPDHAGAIDLKEDLRRAMQSLTDDQQMVLWLRFLRDRSVLETAALMNRSEDAVKNLQRRALAAMQRELAETAYAGERRER